MAAYVVAAVKDRATIEGQPLFRGVTPLFEWIPDGLVNNDKQQVNNKILYDNKPLTADYEDYTSDNEHFDESDDEDLDADDFEVRQNDTIFHNAEDNNGGPDPASRVKNKVFDIPEPIIDEILEGALDEFEAPSLSPQNNLEVVHRVSLQQGAMNEAERHERVRSAYPPTSQ